MQPIINKTQVNFEEVPVPYGQLRAVSVSSWASSTTDENCCEYNL